MRSVIQSTDAYELSVDISQTAFGHDLKLISFIPAARNPMDHVQFQGLFSTTELTAIRDCIDLALATELEPAHPSSTKLMNLTEEQALRRFGYVLNLPHKYVCQCHCDPLLTVSVFTVPRDTVMDTVSLTVSHVTP
jgi:hypothetical protein